MPPTRQTLHSTEHNPSKEAITGVKFHVQRYRFSQAHFSILVEFMDLPGNWTRLYKYGNTKGTKNVVLFNRMAEYFATKLRKNPGLVGNIDPELVNASMVERRWKRLENDFHERGQLSVSVGGKAPASPNSTHDFFRRKFAESSKHDSFVISEPAVMADPVPSHECGPTSDASSSPALAHQPADLLTSANENARDGTAFTEDEEEPLVRHHISKRKPTLNFGDNLEGDTNALEDVPDTIEPPKTPRHNHSHNNLPSPTRATSSTNTKTAPAPTPSSLVFSFIRRSQHVPTRADPAPPLEQDVVSDASSYISTENELQTLLTQTSEVQNRFFEIKDKELQLKREALQHQREESIREYDWRMKELDIKAQMRERELALEQQRRAQELKAEQENWIEQMKMQMKMQMETQRDIMEQNRLAHLETLRAVAGVISQVLSKQTE
ncbi:hypothetical protein EDD21DRAFT_403589 [Dissophora ornata]|nr:hypothetical protein BGZ58_010472 [Dissophora ornata]KAI8602513.1 hypothetical protein EDD21DRAFT_403589 [Dissophora ornata]